MTHILTEGRFAKALVCAAVLAVTALLTALMFTATGCAPQAAGERTPKEDPLASQPVDWSIDGDCAVCHAAEDALMQDANCPQASEHANLACIECHTNTDTLTSVHANLTYGDATKTIDLKPEEETVDSAVCQNPDCHGTMEDMAKLTADNTDFKDEKGKVQNPHEYSSNEQHDANQPVCTDCHKVHSEELQEDAMKWCAQCHHKGVFQCGTCHELRQRAAA